ncbi:tetratricopeptide repeat protein [Paremcibacter congregatus]|uniref:tetratricopeptide repeat protein n=1 Tax=Paremcibacter congregatus TaxID=2043170 RepID=UPI0030EF2EED
MPFLRTIVPYLSLLLIVTISGCSSSVKLQDPLAELAVVTKADLLSGRALFGPEARHFSLPDDDVMALDDEMITYVDQYLSRNISDDTKVHSLVSLMKGAGALGMYYNTGKTYTARQAFHKAEGNCLAFSYLFAALGREKGLKVTFQEVYIPPQWDEGGDGLFYFNRHVNVKVHLGDSRFTQSYVVDVDQINYKPHYRQKTLTDQEAIALYYSNKATDFLKNRDMKNAFLYLVKALKLSPRDGAIWSNLGVLYRLEGLHDYAEKAYFIALRHDRGLSSVLSNLSVLYEEMGDFQKSNYYFRLVKDHQMKNPYYRYFQALEAYRAGDYDLALSHLKAALKRRDDEKRFHQLLGETYAKLGDEPRAIKAEAKVRELMDIN